MTHEYAWKDIISIKTFPHLPNYIVPLVINSSTLLCPSAGNHRPITVTSLCFLDFCISGFFQYVHFICLVSFTHNNYVSYFRGIHLEMLCLSDEFPLYHYGIDYKTRNCLEFIIFVINLTSVQFSSVTQSCPTLWEPMNRSMPGLPVHHQLPEFTQTHVHQIGDAIWPSHPLSSPSPPAPNSSQHQGLFQ